MTWYIQFLEYKIYVAQSLDDKDYFSFFFQSDFARNISYIQILITCIKPAESNATNAPINVPFPAPIIW